MNIGMYLKLETEIVQRNVCAHRIICNQQQMISSHKFEHDHGIKL